MASRAYNEILENIQKMAPYEQLQLLEELVKLLRHQIHPRSRRSLLELRGLGKEIWSGIKVKDYINRERNSWNG